jgi:hypothetical protein
LRNARGDVLKILASICNIITKFVLHFQCEGCWAEGGADFIDEAWGNWHLTTSKYVVYDWSTGDCAVFNLENVVFAILIACLDEPDLEDLLFWWTGVDSSSLCSSLVRNTDVDEGLIVIEGWVLDSKSLSIEIDCKVYKSCCIF